MLKAVVSFAKKVPVPGQEFSSQSFHLSLEQELPATLQQEEVLAQLHQSIETVKTSVENELANGNGNPGLSDQGSNEVPRRNGNGSKISNKQAKFVQDLCRSKSVSSQDLDDLIRKTFGGAGLYDLTKKQASTLLDTLKGSKAA